MFPRVPREVREQIEPILRDRIHADDSHYERGSPNWDMEERLDRLTNNQGAAADFASVILLDYYLGEHNGEAQLCSVTARGPRVLPLLQRYRKHPAGLISPWYATLRLKRTERAYMYDLAQTSIERHETVGCD